MPCLEALPPPVTKPVADTRVIPVPRFSAKIPCSPPVTEATLTVRLEPLAPLRARTPSALCPVTRPVAATKRGPPPSAFATIPDCTPTALATLIASPVPDEPEKAPIP